MCPDFHVVPSSFLLENISTTSLQVGLLGIYHSYNGNDEHLV